MPISKAGAIAALDEAFGDSVKQMFTMLVVEVTGLSLDATGKPLKPKQLADAVAVFNKGLGARLLCHQSACEAVAKIIADGK